AGDPAAGRPGLAGRARGARLGVPLRGRARTGGIGANRACSQETVDALLDDAVARALPVPTGTRKEFDRLVRTRRPDALGLRHLRAIEQAERARGQATGRPRVKLPTVPALLAAARR
ncbi:ferredoxin-NADP reductase, partial [Kitasatospora sp. NPDC001574]